MNRLSIAIAFYVALVLQVALANAQPTQGQVRFQRDIRPILVDKCFACHGPDAETVAGGLRVDLREEAIDADAIVPGKPDESELILRIFSDDGDDIMPPQESLKELTAGQKDLLRRWIAQGAEYQPHWSYTELRVPVPPDLDSLGAAEGLKNWVRNPIDQFVATKIGQAAAAPSEPADRVTMIRRLSIDLTGIPPTPAEVEAFICEPAENAYEILVDRLLASPRFGERMAIYWLDLVRFADTVGYHGDQDISQSPYRDYVIRAFNSNMPYDQFVREQLAGDLLTSPTLNQLVASGYNRLNQTTEEGGAQPNEYLAIYFADRVRNVSQVFMGATVGCAQCHDHKFDPYTSRDFYSLGAFFADIEEVGKYGERARPPVIQVPSAAQQQRIDRLELKMADIRKAIESQTEELLSKQYDWELEILDSPESQPVVTENIWLDDSQDTGGVRQGIWTFVDAESAPVLDGKKSRRQESTALVQHFFIGAENKVSIEQGTRFFAWVFLDPQTPPSAIMLQVNDGEWDHRGVWGTDDIEYGLRSESWPGYFRSGELPETGKWIRLEINAEDIGLQPKSEVNGMAFTQFGGLVHWDAAGWISNSGIPESVAQALAVAPDKRSPDETKQVQDYYLINAEPILELEQELADLKSNLQTLMDSVTLTVISKSVEPRTIRVLRRGNWMDDSGEIVQPAIPAFLGELNTGDRRATRLDLANWLCEPENVLTSRTMANRLWYLMFGRGICISVDDFGGQGAYPANPELLDWLAADFVKSGWDIKHTLRTIVTSATYRQSSKPTPELLALDPFNDLFARQGRFRIDAEMIRDTALSISGLLVEQVGGESVKPYQPADYYAQLNFPIRNYEADLGNNQYRRGVYTHWQRTFLHPMLKAFDAPSREEGTCSRSRSNTPLQALTLLNDPTFVECARVFAERIMREGGTTTEQRITWAYQNAVSRQPEPAVIAEIKRVYEDHLIQFESDRDAAQKLIVIGNAPLAGDLDSAELAAWTSVARIILNLHEMITRY